MTCRVRTSGEVGQDDNDFVMTFLASIKTEKGDIDTLVELAEKASKKTPDDLEKEENEDKAADTKKEERSSNHGSAEEKKTYDPLIRLFSYLAEFDLAASYVRKDQWYARSGRSSHIWLPELQSPRMEQTRLIPNYEGIETLLAK